MTFNCTSVSHWASGSLLCLFLFSGPAESPAQSPLDPADVRRIGEEIHKGYQQADVVEDQLLLPQLTEKAAAIAAKYDPAQLVSYADSCTREDSLFYAAVLTHHADNALVHELITKAYWADEDDGNLAHLAPSTPWLLSYAPIEDVRTRSEALIRQLGEFRPSAQKAHRFRLLFQLLAITGDETTEQVLKELAEEWKSHSGGSFGVPIPGDVRYEQKLLSHVLQQPQGKQRDRWQQDELVYFRLQFETRPVRTQIMYYGDVVQRTLKSGIVLPSAFVRSKVDEPFLAQPVAVGLAYAYGYEELYDELIKVGVKSTHEFNLHILSAIGSPEVRQGLLSGIRPGSPGNEVLARAVAELKHSEDLERLQSFADDERFRESEREYFQILIDRYKPAESR